jgi:hypothetical protein
MSKVEHLAADVATIASLARLFEAEIRELREGDLSRASHVIMKKLVAIRDRADTLIDKWDAKL